jgi:DNA-directed RNA polymerase specialized sigma subunit
MVLAFEKEDYSKYLYIKTIWGKRLRVICVPKDLVENTIYASCNGVEASVIQKDLISKAMLALTDEPRLSYIISMYYSGELNMRQIGEKLGVSRARVSQLHRIAMRIMRKRVL